MRSVGGKFIDTPPNDLLCSGGYAVTVATIAQEAVTIIPLEFIYIRIAGLVIPVAACAELGFPAGGGLPFSGGCQVAVVTGIDCGIGLVKIAVFETCLVEAECEAVGCIMEKRLSRIVDLAVQPRLPLPLCYRLV